MSTLLVSLYRFANHEKSRKHRENVELLKQAFEDEKEKEEEDEDEEKDEEEDEEEEEDTEEEEEKKVEEDKDTSGATGSTTLHQSHSSDPVADVSSQLYELKVTVNPNEPDHSTAGSNMDTCTVEEHDTR